MSTTVAGAFLEPNLREYSYSHYLTEFGKPHDDARETIFNANMILIREHNSDPMKKWAAGPNEFTDWTFDEFKEGRTSRFIPGPVGPILETMGTLNGLPTRVDWREKTGVVTPVKNQGQCGACWAFSATETLESMFAIAQNEAAPVLGPQQIVSCAKVPGGGGCNGGLQTIAFNYTSRHGLTSEADYPYQAVTGTCDPSEIKPVVINSGYVLLKTNDYSQLMTSVATKGPIAISIDAASIEFQFYHGGVYSGGYFGCGFNIDHAVQLVGYGTDDDADMYWLVRNSWGNWGENGYIRLKRFGEGKEPCGKGPSFINNGQVCGMCGIMSMSSYPTDVRKYGGEILV